MPIKTAEIITGERDEKKTVFELTDDKLTVVTWHREAYHEDPEEWISWYGGERDSTFEGPELVELRKLFDVDELKAELRKCMVVYPDTDGWVGPPGPGPTCRWCGFRLDWGPAHGHPRECLAVRLLGEPENRLSEKKVWMGPGPAKGWVNR